MVESLKKQNQFKILKSLERDSRPTQRQLSNDLGVSLGKINYCLKCLIEKVLSRLIILEIVTTKFNTHTY
jgi:DNA-binding Lrp family transcriptional regulator